MDRDNDVLHQQLLRGAGGHHVRFASRVVLLEDLEFEPFQLGVEHGIQFGLGDLEGFDFAWRKARRRQTKSLKEGKW